VWSIVVEREGQLESSSWIVLNVLDHPHGFSSGLIRHCGAGRSRFTSRQVSSPIL
jgi:hypothetical protein